MSVYVDVEKIQKVYGREYSCHMAVGADDPMDELHTFAESLGLGRCWFQDSPRHPHYDLTPNKRRLALAKGATVLGRTAFIRTTTREAPHGR